MMHHPALALARPIQDQRIHAAAGQFEPKGAEVHRPALNAANYHGAADRSAVLAAV